MLRRFGSHLRDQWMGAMALFLVLSGGTAWAVDGPLAGQNSVGSEDIINAEVKAADIGDNAITSDVISVSNGTTKIGPGAIKSQELGANSVFSTQVAPNALGGSDINEVQLRPPALEAKGTERVPAGVELVVDFPTETFDTAAMHSTAADADQFVVPPVAGIYQVRAEVRWSDFALRMEAEKICVAKVSSPASERTTCNPHPGGDSNTQSVSDLILLDPAAGDRLAVWVYQRNGSSTALNAAVQLDVHFIGTR